MKKLLLILLCLPFFGFGEKPTPRQAIKEGFYEVGLNISYLEYHLAILENKPIDAELLKIWKKTTVEEVLKSRDAESIDDLILRVRYGRVVEEDLIETLKYDLTEQEKLMIGFKYMYLLNQSPEGWKKNYFELYWKTAIESFPFIDDYSFRERFGHSYRNELDYIYSAIKFTIQYQKSVKDMKYILFTDFGDREWFKRDSNENRIELFAKYTPFLLFVFFLWLLYRIDILLKTNIFRKYIWFGFVDDNKLKKRLRVFMIIIFLLPQILILTGIIYNSDMFYISIFEEFRFRDYLYFPNEKLDIKHYESIESPIMNEWSKIIVSNLVFWIISYFLTLLLNIRSLKSIKLKK